MITYTDVPTLSLSLNAGSQYVFRVARVSSQDQTANTDDYAWSGWSEPLIVVEAEAGISWSTPPQNSSAPGDPGDVAYDDNYLYLRTSQAWRQVALQPISTAITISQQPQNTTVGDGGSATFTVLANAPEAISYQWSSSADGVSFAAINGATSNTLTINATIADNGSQYRALLSAAGAADVTTNVATLTVNETFRLLTASNDALLTEGGDTVNHDGVGGGGGGGNQPSDDWELFGASLTAAYGFSDATDAGVVYASANGTSITRYSQEANGTWSAGPSVTAVSNVQTTIGQDSFATALDGNSVAALHVAADQCLDGSTNCRLSKFIVWDYSNGTHSQRFSHTISNAVYHSPSVHKTAISRDGSVAAFLTSILDTGVYFSSVEVHAQAGRVGPVLLSENYLLPAEASVHLNGDGTIVAFSSQQQSGTLDTFTRVLQWNGSGWAQLGSDSDLSTSTGGATMAAQPVALSDSGSRIAVGFSAATGDYTQSGVVRVYDWSGSAWVQAGSDISGAAAYDFFGSSVSLSSDGTRLAVGARGNDSAASNAGRTSVYQYSAGSWFKIGTDIDGPAATNSYAGSNVFISGDGNYLGVGASGAETLTRYELQTNQITITQQPQDATYSGSPVTFSTLATVSDNSTPSYQWQTSADSGSTWADVSNATASNLTINSAVAGDDGDQYRAVISASRAPSVTTSAATLTVT